MLPPPDAATLAGDLAASKTPDGRKQLLASGELDRLARHAVALMTSWRPHPGTCDVRDHLLLLLRVLRNVCAAGCEAAALLVARSVAEHAARFAAAAAAEQQQDQQPTLAAAQLLANLAASSAPGVWCSLWPAQLPAMLRSPALAVHEAAALAAFNCTKAACCSALDDLASPAAAACWLAWLEPLMPRAHASSSDNDNVCLLARFVALQSGRLPQLLTVLAAPLPGRGRSAAADGEEELRLSEAQAVLLHVLQSELAADASTITSAAPGWLPCLVRLFCRAAPQALAAAAAEARPGAAAHVLEAVLQVLQAALAAAQQAGAAAGVAQQLHTAGLLPPLLEQLAALGLPPKAAQQQQQQQQQQSGTAGSSAAAQQRGQQGLQQLGARQPYAGYRADLVAVLSNLVYEQRAIQDDALRLGGVEALLNNCNLDDSAPMAREWALWGVRNLTAGNEAVAAHLASFQAVEAVQSAELDAMGMQLELDKRTHKLALVKKPRGEQAGAAAALAPLPAELSELG